jgi:hypothetical protein
MHTHVAPFGHILPIPSEPVFALTPQSCNFSLFFYPTRDELTIYCTPDEHAKHYTINAISIFEESYTHYNPFYDLKFYITTSFTDLL